MKYIANKPFISIVGKPFEIEDKEEGIPKHEAQLSEFLLLILRAYRPQQGKILENLQLRSYNKCLDLLEAPDANGKEWIGFEDTDFKILRLVCDWIIPLTPWFRNGPLIEDLLQQATDKVPEQPQAPSVNGHGQQVVPGEAASVNVGG